ncbi:MAG: cysteine peptidase family C39 domain-containing protein [Dehalococcoidales bacterium]|nr:cysteine peptidase family C39 domain-containing protein [Dehalococcoidales bacterium]
MGIDLPSGRQTFDFDCGAKALQLVLAYYGLDIPEINLLEEMKVSTEGTPLKNMMAVAEKHGFKVYAKCYFTLQKVKEYVDKNIPVIVLVQAWAKKLMSLEEWKHDYDDGHYAIIVDHYGSVLVFEDPASFSKTWMTEKEFMARWHDVDTTSNAKLEHFGMALFGKEPSPKHRMMEHMD